MSSRNMKQQARTIDKKKFSKISSVGFGAENTDFETNRQSGQSNFSSVAKITSSISQTKITPRNMDNGKTLKIKSFFRACKNEPISQFDKSRP